MRSFGLWLNHLSVSFGSHTLQRRWEVLLREGSTEEVLLGVLLNWASNPALPDVETHALSGKSAKGRNSSCLRKRRHEDSRPPRKESEGSRWQQSLAVFQRIAGDNPGMDPK